MEPTAPPAAASSSLDPAVPVPARRVGYVWSAKSVELAEKILVHRGREHLIHSLIEAYGLTKRMVLLSPTPASDADLESFHSIEYIQCLKKAATLQGNDTALDEEHGLVEDCPLFSGVYEYVKQVAGTSLTAARALIDRKCDIVLNWFGGRHHCKKCEIEEHYLTFSPLAHLLYRDEASGYCYVNDIVIAILELMPHYDRILYVDLDVHHGDGVEEAFEAFKDVVTLSIHLRRPGFFPGSGDAKAAGVGRGKYHTINLPLLDGIDDVAYCALFDTVFDATVINFQPSLIVLQCGADSLAGDPLGGFNLSSSALVACAQRVFRHSLPTLVLGGGGYVPANAARLWTKITAAALGVTVSSSVPDHDDLEKYRPGFSLDVPAWYTPNRNTKEYLAELTASAVAMVGRIGGGGEQQHDEASNEDSGGDEGDGEEEESSSSEEDERPVKKQAIES